MDTNLAFLPVALPTSKADGSGNLLATRVVGNARPLTRGTSVQLVRVLTAS